VEAGRQEMKRNFEEEEEYQPLVLVPHTHELVEEPWFVVAVADILMACRRQSECKSGRRLVHMGQQLAESIQLVVAELRREPAWRPWDQQAQAFRGTSEQLFDHEQQ
jgi:hypothetical protein